LRRRRCAPSRRVCSSGAHLEPVLEQDDPGLDHRLLEAAAPPEEVAHLLSRAEPITRSTPARLYQLRSKITISPAAGKCGM
jgi:hypothetical protein